MLGGIILANVIKLQLVLLGFDPEQKYRRQISPLAESEKASQIQAITVGNSHSIAIDFNTLDLQGYHLWQPASDIFEADFMLESWLPKLPMVKTVLFVASYDLFYARNIDSPSASEKHRVLYSQTPSWLVMNNDLGNFVIGKLNRVVPILHISRPDHWRRVVFNVGTNGLSDFPRAEDGQLLRPSYINCNYLSVEEMNELAEYRGNRIKKQLATVKPGTTVETYRTIGEIVNYLKARNIRIVFYTPPYHDLFNQLYQGHLESDFLNTMDQLQEEYRVEYYNFSKDSAFRDSRFFKDIHHMNLCGAKGFSTIMNDILTQPAH